ncbi:OLC1v1003473C1 [Oldenlandia corymbosa var. corymbosa]|uniref:Choline transporter-like protein n=1 Tax=Oldenlandia corymbosa var. corymbosa TaxID=529605 RepID=A0AAV1DBZ9_OLDCO|nr:OLC1v1003473C1 [Oldenlandia corymbosa var. corymbosa]
MESTSNSSSASTDQETPSQPLISKPLYPSVVDAPPSQPPIASVSYNDGGDDDQSQFLHITYKHGPRQFKDWPFLILFILLILATFGFGIFACVHRNPYSPSQVSSFIYNSTSSSCTLLQNPGSLTEPISLNSLKKPGLLKTLIWTLVITLILSLPFVLFVLFSLKHYTKQIVYIALPFFVIVPVFINVYWFVACTVSSSCSESFPLVYRILVLVFVFLVIGVIVWIFLVNWHRVELTINIIGVAANALSQNLGLFGVLPCLTFVLLLYYSPIVVFLVFSRLNGKIVPKEDRNGEFYCVWKEDKWVPAYYTLGILTMLWSATAMIEAQVYVISGTIAQWYFSKDYERPEKSLRSALRNAFGPSSGTVCLSGLLTCVVRVVRAMVDNARQEDAPSGIVNIILRCCVNALMVAFDFLNKFTINFAAITGEAYCTSARITYELLRRNLLSAAFVETVSTRILAGIIFVLSAIYAIVVSSFLLLSLCISEIWVFEIS